MNKSFKTKVTKLLPLAVVGILGLAVSNAQAISVLASSDGNALVNNILGTGITASNINYIGETGQAGTFGGGIASGIGIESGILLTSGLVSNALGPNNDPGATGDLGTAGDADLDVASGQTTFDANVLEFDFTTTGGDLFFQYVFASEEYLEFVNSGVNDAFAFLLDGVNIATVPGTAIPVSIDTVNLDTNSLFYNDNPEPGSADTQYDGFTDVFTASALGLSAGIHHIKLVIGDGGDNVLDSGVFIAGGSFSDTQDPPIDPPVVDASIPGTLGLLFAGLLSIGAFRKKLS